MMPLTIVHVRRTGSRLTCTTGISDGVRTASTSHTIVGTFTFGDQCLPVRVEGCDSEPAGNGHVPARKLEVVFVTTGDFNKLILSIETDRRAKGTIDKHGICRSSGFAMETTHRVIVVVVECPIGY